MVLKVYEACVLEALEHSLSSGLFGGRVSGEEHSEVNELSYVREGNWKAVDPYWNDQVILRDGLAGVDVRHTKLGVACNRSVRQGLFEVESTGIRSFKKDTSIRHSGQRHPMSAPSAELPAAALPWRAARG